MQCDTVNNRIFFVHRSAFTTSTQMSLFALDMGLLSKIDLFEKVAQFMYTGQLLFVPTFWITDNLADASVANKPEGIMITQICAVLCGCLAFMTFVVRGSKEATKPLLAKFDVATSLAWGACGVANMTLGSGLYKPDKMIINVCLQTGLAAAFYWQSTTR